MDAHRIYDLTVVHLFKCIFNLGPRATLTARHRAVVPKLVRAATQIKVAMMSYYPRYFAEIAHNTEQHCGFGSALPPVESYITPRG